MKRWRTLYATLVLALSLATGRPAAADTTVPVALQVQLVAKMAAFDRNFPARAAGGVRVMVMRNPGSEESGATALRLVSALSGVRQIGGLAVQSEVVDFSTPAAIAERVRAQRVAILYLSAGLESQVGGLAAALEGLDVLTVGPSGAYAELGAVVGFDLDEGRPQMVINTGRARSQNVSFKAELLKMARIVGSSPGPGRP